MNAADIAVAFADRLCRMRELTTEETDMLQLVVVKRRSDWLPSEVETLRSFRAAGRLAPAIARELGRSEQAVRSKLRNLKRGERRGVQS